MTMTEAEFTSSIDRILDNEGREFQPGNAAAGDPCDKFGITPEVLGQWRNLGRDATPAEVEGLDEFEARDIYRLWYIIGPHFDRIEDPAVRQFTIDFGVNSGVERATWYLQKAVGATPDMILGPVTLALVNGNNADWSLTLLCRLVRARVNALTRWIRARPAARGKYTGVIDRAVSFLPQ